MMIHRLDHVGVVVNDYDAAKAFFLELGLVPQGEMKLEGAWLDHIIGLEHVKTEFVMLGAPDGQATLELIKFHSPAAKQDIQPSLANTPGIRHLTFAVQDLEGLVAKLKKRGVEFFSEIQTYETSYKLCYCRGPEGIILELAEEIH